MKRVYTVKETRRSYILVPAISIAAHIFILSMFAYLYDSDRLYQEMLEFGTMLFLGLSILLCLSTHWTMLICSYLNTGELEYNPNGWSQLIRRSIILLLPIIVINIIFYFVLEPSGRYLHLPRINVFLIISTILLFFSIVAGLIVDSSLQKQIQASK